MDVEFDPVKNEENRRKHGISLQRAEDFELGPAQIELDERQDYGEARYNALGYLGEVLFSLTFTLRGNRVRAISLRPANRKERRVYASSRTQA